eukprot:gene26908-biopygen17490
MMNVLGLQLNLVNLRYMSIQISHQHKAIFSDASQ